MTWQQYLCPGRVPVGTHIIPHAVRIAGIIGMPDIKQERVLAIRQEKITKALV